MRGIIALVTLLGGCIYPFPLHTREAKDECSAEQTISFALALPQDGSPGCSYAATVSTSDVGTGFLLLVDGSDSVPMADVYASQTESVFYEVNTTVACTAPGATSDVFNGIPAANDYFLDFASPACFGGCDVSTNVVSPGSVPVTMCDESQDFPTSAVPAGFPPPPADSAFTMRRPTGAAAGRYWFQVWKRSGGNACALLRWAPEGSPIAYSGVVLATETTGPAGANAYAFLGQRWIPGLSGGTATVSNSGNNRTVAASTGSSSLDQALGMGSSALFTPAFGQGVLVVSREEAWAYERLCTDLIESQ